MPTTAPDVDVLLVIDMQNSFCHPKGTMYNALGAPLYDIARVVDANTAVVSAARAADIPVVFTRQQYYPGHADFGPLFPQFREHLTATGGLLAGSWDADLIDAFDCGPDDLIVSKSRLDGFHNTGLETLLRSLSATRLAIIGVMTNACVETTARAAAMRDYSVTILADCTTSGQQHHRDKSLECLSDYHIAEVRQSSELPQLGG
jgi:ureidoacrylate peracid hydrolase